MGERTRVYLQVIVCLSKVLLDDTRLNKALFNKIRGDIDLRIKMKNYDFWFPSK